MNRELPKLSPAPSIDSLEGLKQNSEWWRSVNHLARSEASKLLMDVDPKEATKRHWFEEAIIRHRLTNPPSSQCAHGHFVTLSEDSNPKICGICGDATIESCTCGASVLLTYTYKPPYRKVNPSSGVASREVCFGCSRLYPWAFSYLHRPTEEDLNEYEEQMLPFCVGFPDKKKVDAERQAFRSCIIPVPVSTIGRLFGFRVDVSDPRHPQHSRWLQIDSKYEASYQELVSAFREELLKERQERLQVLAERQDKAAKQKEFWERLSGTEFEKELARLLDHAGFAVEHVGGKGDEGADLVVRGGQIKIVVQCKAYNKAVGPGPVRDLFGALMHHKANEAWLVSLEGFSVAATSFARGKPIRLISISALLGTTGRKFLAERKKEC